jgi:outer membrane immunogenic protein
MKRLAALLAFAFACPGAHADWSGPYLGAGVGVFLGEATWSPSGPLAPFPDVPARMDFDGVMLSGKVGYRLQANRFVFGLEGEYSRARVNGSAFCLGSGTAFICETELRHQIKVTGQIGYASDPWLPYLTLGYVRASLRASVFAPTSELMLAGNGTHDGLLLGVGLDYRVTPWVSVGFEYQHIWYESDTYGMAPGIGLPSLNLAPSSTKIAIDPDYVAINVKVRLNGSGN